MLTVEGILALNHTGVCAEAKLLAGRLQGRCDAKVGYGREFDGRIFKGGVLVANCTGGNYNVAGLNVKVNATTGSDADEGVCADCGKLLHGNRGGRTADTCGANRNLLSEQSSCVDVIFSVHTDMNGVIKVLCNFFTSSGVTGKENVATNVTYVATNVKLCSYILHKIFPHKNFLLHQRCKLHLRSKLHYPTDNFTHEVNFT